MTDKANYKIEGIDFVKLMFDFPDSVDWLHNRTILLTVSGSMAYGTNTPESDRDYKGVTIPPEEYYLGLKHFNDYNTTGGKNWKSTKDTVDISIMHLNKFVMDAMAGVPNNIEILFVRPEDILVLHKHGQELLSHKHDFLSKAVKRKFGGFSSGQVVKMINNTGREELINQYGYDTKYGYHAVRVMTSLIDILKTGTFSTYRPNREELLAIRQGKYTLTQLLKIIEDLDQEIKELYLTSRAIPDNPDYDKINTWLIDINKRALTERW